MDWIQKNFKTIIYISFVIPILLVAFVSISHVTTWYGLSNPLSWAIYLSVGIEIAALSALAAISAQMGKKVYLPFGIVTLIQFIGNIFFAYQFIDVDSEAFRDWVDLVDPVVSYLGVESGNFIAHKRFLALFSGGMLPIISLSFLHMLVKFEEEDKQKKSSNDNVDIDEISKFIGKEEGKIVENKYSPSEEELNLLEEQLRKIDEIKFRKKDINEDEFIENQELTLNDNLNIPSNEVEEYVSQETNVNIDNVEKIEIEPDFYLENEDNSDFYFDTPNPTTSLNESQDEPHDSDIKRLSYKSSR